MKLRKSITSDLGFTAFFKISHPPTKQIVQLFKCQILASCKQTKNQNMLLEFIFCLRHLFSCQTYTSPFSDIAAVWYSPHDIWAIFTSSGASSKHLAKALISRAACNPSQVKPLPSWPYSL